MTAPLPVWLAIVSVIVFFAVVYYYLTREFNLSREARAFIVFLGLAIILLFSYLAVSPYYYVTPKSVVTIPVNYTYTTTTVINGTTTTITKTVTGTRTITEYESSNVPFAYFGVVYAIVLVLIVIALYYVFKMFMKGVSRSRFWVVRE